MQFNVHFELNLGIALIIGLGLVIFGLAYNHLVGWLEANRMDRGYTAILVVVGTIVTLLAALPIIGLGSFLVVLVAFAFSGAPMVIGSMWRHAHAEQARDAEWRATIKEMVGQNRQISELAESVDALIAAVRGEDS